MKKYLLYFSSLVVAFFLATILAVPQIANAFDTGDGHAHEVITLTGTSSPGNYTVSGKMGSGGSISFTRSGSTFTSQPIPGAGSCSTITDKQNLNMTTSVTLNGKAAAPSVSSADQFCNSSSAIDKHSVKVSSNPAASLGSITVKVTYKGSDNSDLPFKSSATGTLKGGPSNQTYNLNFGDDGTVKVSNLEAGTYTLSADYAVPGGKNHHYEKTITLAAGQNTNLSGAATNKEDTVGTGTGTAASSSNTADASKLGCDLGINLSVGGIVNAFNPLNYIFCGLVKGMVGVVDVLDNFITSQLSVGTDGNSDNPNQIFADSNGCSRGKACDDYKTAWASFRNIALDIIVIAGLIILIAQAIGTELLDAYTIRKTLPRILVAAIAITLSWPLMKFFVTLTNDLGFGIRHLIYSPFNDLPNSAHLNLGQSFITTIFGGIGYFLSGAFGLLALVATAMLAVFVAFLVLVLRQIAIILLIIIAPIAIVAYILPNTQKYYKLWWESFSLALLMFPFIAGFIAVGRVFSAISISAGDGLQYQLIGVAAYVAPYFLIPATFKFAGGALRQIGGFVNDRSRGAFDGLRKARQNNTKKRLNAARTGGIYRPTFGKFGEADPNTGERKSVGKLLNKFGDWTLDFDERARYGLGNRKVPGFKRGYEVMKGQIQDATMKQSTKAAQDLGLDYKTGWAASGLFNKFDGLDPGAQRTLDKNYGTQFDPNTGRATAWRAPRGLQEMNQVADLLATGDINSREAAAGLHTKAPLIDQAVLEDETRRTDSRLVGLMSAAQQGRLENDDIVNNHNMLVASGQRERAMRETTMLQDISAPKRTSLARGHGIEFTPEGRAINVYTDPLSDKAQGSITRMSMQDVANSKAEDLRGDVGETWIAGASDMSVVYNPATGQVEHEVVMGPDGQPTYAEKTNPDQIARARELQNRLKSMAMYNYGDSGVGVEVKRLWERAGLDTNELSFKPSGTERSPADMAGMVTPPTPPKPDDQPGPQP